MRRRLGFNETGSSDDLAWKNVYVDVHHSSVQPMIMRTREYRMFLLACLLFKSQITILRQEIKFTRV
jgi:hypothetical protein